MYLALIRLQVNISHKYLGSETITYKPLSFDLYTLSSLVFLFMLQFFFNNPLFYSLLIGYTSPYRVFFILLVFETCRLMFNLIIWTINLVYALRSYFNLFNFNMPFTGVFLLSLIGIPVLGLPFDIFCLLAMHKYSNSLRDLPNLSLLIVSLPFIVVNLYVWIKHAGWENSYSARNHFLGLLYSFVLYSKKRKQIASLSTKRFLNVILKLFGWVSLIMGWQYPHVCFELVHLWTLLHLLSKGQSYDPKDG
jgi:hypothetical protein